MAMPTQEDRREQPNTSAHFWWGSATVSHYQVPTLLLVRNIAVCCLLYCTTTLSSTFWSAVCSSISLFLGLRVTGGSLLVYYLLYYLRYCTNYTTTLFYLFYIFILYTMFMYVFCVYLLWCSPSFFKSTPLHYSLVKSKSADGHRERRTDSTFNGVSYSTTATTNQRHHNAQHRHQWQPHWEHRSSRTIAGHFKQQWLRWRYW